MLPINFLIKSKSNQRKTDIILIFTFWFVLLKRCLTHHLSHLSLSRPWIVSHFLVNISQKIKFDKRKHRAGGKKNISIHLLTVFLPYDPFSLSSRPQIVRQLSTWRYGWVTWMQWKWCWRRRHLMWCAATPIKGKR